MLGKKGYFIILIIDCSDVVSKEFKFTLLWKLSWNISGIYVQKKIVYHGIFLSIVIFRKLKLKNWCHGNSFGFTHIKEVFNKIGISFSTIVENYGCLVNTFLRKDCSLVVLTKDT